MHAIERCGLPYAQDGDIRECRLAYNHDDDCPAANRAAFIAELASRADAARAQLDRWVF